MDEPQVHEFTPSVSVVTPCYNSGAYIEEAIDSVRQHECTIEHIIVDGGSTDGTLDTLARYPDLEIISEPDRGIYHALNKGIRRASGEYIGWLNADDYYTYDAFKSFAEIFDEEDEPDLLAGSCEVFELVDGSRRTVDRYTFTPPRKFRQGQILHQGALLNGCLFNSSFLSDIGEFDDSLDISADTEYLVRIAAANPHIARTEDIVYAYRHHSDSITFNDNISFNATRERALREGREFMCKFMNDSSLPDPLIQYCQREYRARSGALFLGYIFRGQLNRAMQTAVESIQSDRGWPSWMFNKIVQRTKERVLAAR